jgi:integrase
VLLGAFVGLRLSEACGLRTEDIDFLRAVVHPKVQYPARQLKTVQARLRHASAKTTLDTYDHSWPDRDESTRAAVDAVLTAYLTEQRRNSATAEP